jgi:hypothetical protein
VERELPVRAAPGVEAARLALGAEGELVAHVTGSGLSAAELEERTFAHVHRAGIVVPDRFQVSGATEPSHAMDPHGPAGDALLAALRGVGGIAEPDASHSYPGQGGRGERAPAVLHRLERQGWAGLSCEDLVSPRSVRHLASHLAEACESAR